MSLAAAPIALSEDDRDTLERWVRADVTPQGVARRAWVILQAADGVSNSEISRETGLSRPTVIAVRERFADDGPGGLAQVKPGRGRKPRIPQERIAEIVNATLHETPSGETHWSCRSMAKAKGVSPATVQRIWDAHNLKPHRVRTFKLSRDKRFVEKLTDVVGLYLNPPEKAIVLCVDEEVRHEALSDSSGVKDPDAGLPQRPGGS